MNRQVSPKQVALALGVSEASVKRWCDQGLMTPARTAGGHRRIAIHDVIQFARSRGNPLIRADVLGLPAVSNGGEVSANRAVDEAFDILAANDERRLLQLMLNLYLSRWTMLDIVERVLSPAWLRIGTGWEQGNVEIFEERRAVEITLAALRDLTTLIPPPPADAPLAISATLVGDTFALPIAMGTLALREAGINAENFGIGLPAQSIVDAILERQPKLVWISVSMSGVVDKEDLSLIADAARSVHAPLVIGGRALPDEIVPASAVYSSNLTELVNFIRMRIPAPAKAAMELQKESGAS